ncbi:hypothetical protein [Zavarzinella formosa]|uniref:hypothetical protein n=1 Tax=Zavarzinella formosa TaxID=360055 RepID=UPI00031EF4D2|nr:hypothetical protein [Zavarzinella formosa]
MIPTYFDRSAPASYEDGTATEAAYLPAESPPIVRRSSRVLQRPNLQTLSSVNIPTPQSDPMINLPPEGHDHGLVDQLRAENQQFNQLLDEMRQLLQEASDQQERLQTELDSVNEAYEAARVRLTELEEIVNAKPKTKDELEEWSDELEREASQLNQQKKLLGEERRQLQDDEMSLEKQMRQMEVGMARERAMLARQETELKRLSAEVQREIEAIQRGDAGLRDRMAVFQRRHAEAMGLAGGGYPTAPSVGGMSGIHPAVSSASSTSSTSLGTMPGASSPTPTPKKNDTTGLLRKLFRSGE